MSWKLKLPETRSSLSLMVIFLHQVDHCQIEELSHKTSHSNITSYCWKIWFYGSVCRLSYDPWFMLRPLKWRYIVKKSIKDWGGFNIYLQLIFLVFFLFEFSFVEIVAPVFSRDAWRCVWHTIQVPFSNFVFCIRMF